MTYPLSGLMGRLDNEVSSDKVKQFDISPILMFSKVEKDVYYLKFSNMCNTNQVIKGVISVDNKVLQLK